MEGGAFGRRGAYDRKDVAGEELGRWAAVAGARVTLRKDPSGAASLAEKFFGAAAEHEFCEAAVVGVGEAVR